MESISKISTIVKKSKKMNLLEEIANNCIQSGVPLEYKRALMEQRRENISKVRESIDTKESKLKIKNWADNNFETFEDVREKILIDDMFVKVFAIDPKKQNTAEKLAAKYLELLINKIAKNKGESCKFKNLPNSAKVFIYEGEIVNKRPNKSIKSVDFYFEIGDYKFYCTHKYTEPHGGSQGDAWSDARNFMRESSKSKSKNTYFLTILDGPYYEDHNLVSVLNRELQNERCVALRIEDIGELITREIF
jgi:hypothetical protein